MTEQSGRDLMFQDEIRDIVAAFYRGVDAGAGWAVAERFYSPEELAQAPEQAITWALGVGNPVRHAALSAGEVVLDVGCGAGIDSILAARQVGPTGRVIGLDLLAEMCQRASRIADEAGVAGWCEFMPGEMEALPIPDASVDVVLSNGVINLSPRKSRALAEIARVLRPGGRLCVADLTVEDDLPPDVVASEAAWAGCIAGALSRRVFEQKLERIGFTAIDFTESISFSIDDVALYPFFTDEVIQLMRRLIPEDAQQRVATALIVRATKPPDQTAMVDARQELLEHAFTGSKALEDIPPAKVKAPGVTVRNLKRVEDIELKVMDVEPHAGTPFHTHPHAHEAVVVSGSGALRLEDRREPLRPGDVFSVAPTEPHAIECDGSDPFRIVCMDCFVE